MYWLQLQHVCAIEDCWFIEALWMIGDCRRRALHTQTEKKPELTEIARVFPVDRRALWTISNEIGHDQVCRTRPNRPHLNFKRSESPLNNVTLSTKTMSIKHGIIINLSIILCFIEYIRYHTFTLIGTINIGTI